MNYSIKKIKDLGHIPATPSIPISEKCDLEIPKNILLSEASKFGYPISFIQEQKGYLIQNIIPVFKTETEQISTSSKVELALHTEAAFHPHKPDYVMLLCLRGDDSAATTLACVDKIISLLDRDTIDCLSQPWFVTGVDKSFERPFDNNFSDITTPILFFDKNKNEYKMIYDHDLMKPTNNFAGLALELFNDAIKNSIEEVYLSAGDLLLIDNSKVIHGRKPFQPKYDGTDRWLQRLLVKKEVESIKNKKLIMLNDHKTYLIEENLI